MQPQYAPLPPPYRGTVLAFGFTSAAPLQDGVNGFCVPSGNAIGYTEATRKLVQNSSLRSEVYMMYNRASAANP